MSCPKTVHLLQEYFSDSLSVQAGAEFDKHLAQCGECRAELDTLLLTRQELLSWQEPVSYTHLTLPTILRV